MALVAYASADAAPTTNPHVDFVIDLNAGGTIGAGVSAQLYGSGVDSTDGAPNLTYAWSLLSKPTGSNAAISSATAQNPTLNAVDVWGNYRLMLTVTNTNNAAVSETNALKAPSSAFVIVRVKSTNQAIQKPAPGERNWHDDIYVWADKIEAMSSGLVPHNIVDHADVVDATGADLEALTGGAYAEDPAGTNPANPQGVSILHKHYGSTVDPATTTIRGTVVTAQTPANPTNPVVLTNETIVYTGTSALSFGNKWGNAPAGFPGVVGGFAGIADMETGFPSMVTPHVVFNIGPPTGAGVTVTDFACFLVFEGRGVGRPYQFELVVADTDAAAAAHTWAPLGGANVTLIQGDPSPAGITGVPDFDGESLSWIGNNVNGVGGLPQNVLTRKWLGVVCRQHPKDVLGAMLTVTITCKRLHS